MKHKTWISSLVVVMTMTGCKIQKKSEVAAAKQAQAQVKQQPTKQINTRSLRLDDVYIEFEGQPQPNVYNMILSWPETHDRVRISADGQVMFAVNTFERDKEGIANLQGGRKVSILVEVLDEKYHVITSGVREIEVPKDYVFPNEFKLVSDLNIQAERIFLNNSIVTTEDFNLSLKTKKLIVLDKSTTSEKSRIQNFAVGAKAKHGKNGRNGGLIHIEAEEAQGDLTFLMNSEAGGDALKGFFRSLGGGIFAGSDQPTTTVCVFGTNGFAAGKNGDLNLKVKHISDFRPYVQETLSAGGKLAPVLMNPDTAPDYPSLSMATLAEVSCPNRPSVGAEATTGKICLTFSGQVPADGCE